MQIDIPHESEKLVKAQTQAAGFDNVTDYVLNLIQEDDVEQFDRGRLAVEGLESGDGGSLASEDWKTMQANLEKRIASRQRS